MAYIGPITNKTELRTATNRVLQQVGNAIVNCLDLKTAKKLLFWLDTWSDKYLPNEQSFDYNDLKYYESGNVIQANLGFKVGSEQGGLHYCLIIEKENDKANKTVIVIPLGSLEDGKNPNDINGKSEVFLGYGIFKDEITKFEGEVNILMLEIAEFIKEDKNFDDLKKVLNKYNSKLEKYKKGTIALLNQMCALSKIRIYTPKHVGEELSTFKLTDDKLDEIDKKISEMFMKQQKHVEVVKDIEDDEKIKMASL